MEIAQINPVTGDDVWQMSQTTRQQTTAVVAPGGAAKTGDAENAAGKEEEATLLSKQVDDVLESINHTFNMLEIGLQFELDSDYKDVIVKVVDKESGDVIRQIPSEAMVRVAKAIDKLKGLLVEQTA